MKNLKVFENELLAKVNNSKVLSREEKKLILAGQYASREECELDCQSGSAGNFPDFMWNSWGGSPGGCYLEDAQLEIWDCRDS